MAQKVSYSFLLRNLFSANASKIGRSAATLDRRMKDLAKSSVNAGKSLKKAGTATRAFSLVSAAALGVSVKSFSDIESGVTNVLTLLDDTAAVKKWSGAINAATISSIKLGFGTEETTKALFNQVSQLGANTPSFKAFEQAQILAIAGVTDLNTAVLGIANVMNVYGAETTDARRVMNSFFSSQKAGATDVQRLATSVGDVSSIAFDAGVSFEELLATMAVLTKGGLSQEIATTALRTTFNSLIGATGLAAKALRLYGIPTKKSELRNIGLAESLKRLNLLNKEHPDLLKIAIPEVRAMGAVTALTDEKIKLIIKTMKRINIDMRDGTGATSAFGMQMETFSRAALQVWGALRLVAAGIGAAVAPTFKFLAAVIISVAGWFNTLGSTIKSVVGALLGMFAVLSPILTVVGTIMIIAGKSTLFFGAIFSLTAAVIVGAGVLIIGAVVAIVKNWDFLINKAKQLKDAVFGFVGNIFSGDSTLDVKGDSNITQTSKSTVAIKINAPKGIVNSIKTSSSGNTPGLAIGVNLAEGS